MEALARARWLVVATAATFGGCVGSLTSTDMDGGRDIADARIRDADQTDAGSACADELPARHVLYLNFEGATVDAALIDDASLNQSGLVRSWWGTDQVLVPAFDSVPYGTGPRGEVIDAVVQHVRTLFAAYDIEVTTTRPGTGRYAMALIGGAAPPGSYILGVAPLDCGAVGASSADVVYNARGDVEIAFVFSDEGAFGTTERVDTYAVQSLAISIGHEVGHAFGLGHTSEHTDVMCWCNTPTSRYSLAPYADRGHCGDGTVQDGDEILARTLGLAPEDRCTETGFCPTGTSRCGDTCCREGAVCHEACSICLSGGVYFCEGCQVCAGNEMCTPFPDGVPGCCEIGFPIPVIFPDGSKACCEDGFPEPVVYPDGTETCCARGAIVVTYPDGAYGCCSTDYPTPVIFPDGFRSCCGAAYPQPCMIDGERRCCAS